MAKARTKAPAKPDADPDRLIRQADGGYRSADERFSVEQANGNWFLADQETADDFGQPRVAGPFATLKLVKDAIPRVRAGPTPLRKPIKQTKRPAKAAPPPKPETWLDRLSAEDRRNAERLVRALERSGLPDADAIAEAQITGGRGVTDLARRLLSAKLDAVLADADEKTRALVADALRIVTSDGTSTGRDLPGWALMVLEADGSVTERRIELD
jgi:hypothetical protein